jgi:hypothetical protein
MARSADAENCRRKLIKSGGLPTMAWVVPVSHEEGIIMNYLNHSKLIAATLTTLALSACFTLPAGPAGPQGATGNTGQYRQYRKHWPCRCDRRDWRHRSQWRYRCHRQYRSNG